MTTHHGCQRHIEIPKFSMYAANGATVTRACMSVCVPFSYNPSRQLRIQKDSCIARCLKMQRKHFQFTGGKNRFLLENSPIFQ